MGFPPQASRQIPQRSIRICDGRHKLLHCKQFNRVHEPKMRREFTDFVANFSICARNSLRLSQTHRSMVSLCVVAITGMRDNSQVRAAV